jgi:2-hydroxychromene-2-carboxylate isomerase
MAAATVQFWFDLASTYSYLAAMRVEPLAAAAGVTVEWRPFLLGPIFAEQLGIKDSPFNTQPARGRYMWRDVERLCAKHGLAWRRPSQFPRNSLLAARVGCAVAAEPWAPSFFRSVFRANFVEDRDIADAAVLASLLSGADRDAEALLAQASSAEVKQALRDRTAEAARLGIFGAPSFIAGGELFFGQDRLDDALAWASAAR